MTSAVPYAEVIGDPIAQSKSPAIHRFWLNQLEIEADYRATRVARADFKAFLANRRADPAWRGCNVTMPLKLDALFAADDPTDRATATGAANLLTLRDGKLVAANTDVGAVQNLLAPLARDSVIVLGNAALGGQQVQLQPIFGLQLDHQLVGPRPFLRMVDRVLKLEEQEDALTEAWTPTAEEIAHVQRCIKLFNRLIGKPGRKAMGTSVEAAEDTQAALH